ncbi:MAG: hypothetical protein OEZ20_08385 [candidate division WOR-3 bacterium]|nr:hypothetical protein [candidate division WOR-3 bacterium]
MDGLKFFNNWVAAGFSLRMEETQPEGYGYQMGGLKFFNNSVAAGFSLRSKETQPEGCGYSKVLLRCVMLL